MKNIQKLILTSLLGGFIAILPIAVLLAAFNWIFNLITTIIQPFTKIIIGGSGMKEIVGHFIVLFIMAIICFVLGLIVRTNVGKIVHSLIEEYLLQKIPGYNLVKETILQFFGNKKSPFSSVALANIFCNDTAVTAFITDEHEDGSFTVFVPTGPNPTSGNIYHLKAEYVTKINVPIEDTMRSIISCGSGSNKIINKKIKQTQ